MYIYIHTHFFLLDIVMNNIHRFPSDELEKAPSSFAQSSILLGTRSDARDLFRRFTLEGAISSRYNWTLDHLSFTQDV